MITRDASRPFSQLWQIPLLLLSLAVFASAACLFLEARPVISLNQKLAPARTMLANERPEAAIEALTRLIASQRLPRDGEAQVHLLLAEAMESAQRQRRQPSDAAHAQIIEHTQIALAQGITPTGEVLRRMGESYEALGRPVEAVSNYRQAMAIEPSRALRLQRKVIDLQLANCDWEPAEASLDAYLASDGLSDAERAWAKNEKAQLLIDRGQYVDARRMLEDALKLDSDPIASAVTRYRLGVCAWKLKEADEAQKQFRAARAVFKGQHPLDAKAAHVLGVILAENNESTEAIAMFDVAAVSSDAGTALAAELARGSCRIERREIDEGTEDLMAAARKVTVGTPAMREGALAALQKASQVLASRSHHPEAIEILLAEQALCQSVGADFHSRLAAAYEKRAQQVEQSVADASGAEKVRRTHLAREFFAKAADAKLAQSRALAGSEDNTSGDALMAAVDLHDRIGQRQRAADILEEFASEHADHPLAADALLRLGRIYDGLSEQQKSTVAYQRLASVIDQAGERPVSKEALLELARVQHRTGNFQAALQRLEQLADKFPDGDHRGEVIYLTADCHAQLAMQIDDRAASASASADGNDGSAALAMKRQQLAKASELFARAAEIFRASPPTAEAEKRYRETCALRRADCAYELGEFAEAITLYESAAKEPKTALAAYVQIVNANVAMGQMDEARAANERARTLMNKLPAEAFADGTFAMPRAYWEQWLKLTNDAGE